MIDTMGYGIHSIHIRQARRYFPMPDYDLSNPHAVRMTVYGSIVDPAYSRILIQKTDLPLDEILALDETKKSNKIGNLLTNLRRRGTLVNKGSNKKPSWELVK